jgi:hypothetical protein
MNTDLLTAALDYATHNLPVFPCQPRRKRPLTAHGLKDATTDEAQIRSWWTRWPDANIGIRTGVVFDVLDIDGATGIEQLGLLLRAAHGHDDEEALWLPDTPIAYTPNDGVHILVAPTGYGNRAGMRPGIDYRGAAGYIVAPPSIGANGTAYRWWSPVEEPVDLAAFAQAPGWLLELLNPTPTPPTTPAALARGSRYAEAAVVDECNRVATATIGTRNATLNAAAFSLGQLVAAGLLDAGAVVAALLDAALRAGLGDKEARATIESGLGAGLQHPRKVA